MKDKTVDFTDEDILNLVQRPGTQERGFRLLIERYQERLYWQIRRIVIDHEDANDVVQNCFVKVFRSIHNFQGKSKLYTWLYRIATNEAITFVKKKKKKQATASIESEELNLANRLVADPYFDGSAAQVRLQCALATLPTKQKIVFNLRYFEEMPYNDMAEILDTSVGALKASYHHAVKKIEHYFKEVVI